jgi:hypothetical protein
MKINMFNDIFIKHNQETVKIVSSNLHDINSKIVSITQLQEKILGQVNEFEDYRKNITEETNTFNAWLKSQQVLKKNPTPKKEKIPPQTAVVFSLNYFLSIHATHNDKPCTSDSTFIQQLWRNSVIHYIFVTLNILEKYTAKKEDITLLQMTLTNQSNEIDLETLHKIKLHINTDLVTTIKFFQKNPIASAISLDGLKKHLTPEKKENCLSNLSTIQCDVKKLHTALKNIKLLFSVTDKLEMSNFQFISDSHPHHLAAIKTLIIMIESLYAKILQSGRQIPDPVKQFFNINGINILEIKNKIIQQAECGNKHIFNYIKNICVFINKGIDHVNVWENTLRNGTCHLTLAPTTFNATTLSQTSAISTKSTATSLSFTGSQ